MFSSTVSGNFDFYTEHFCMLKIELLIIGWMSLEDRVEGKDSGFKYFFNSALLEECPNTELFLVRIFPYSDRMRENTDQK